jgi:hypothetical protein
MIRTGLLALFIAGATLAGPAVRADTGGIDNEDARFTFHRAEDGYLRLDGRSGQVSLCTRRSTGWLCQAVPDERAALEAEIARLQSDNAVLKKELLARHLQLPSGIRPDPQPKVEAPLRTLPDEVEINRALVFIEKVWRRLVEMITNVQRDILKKT